jgi:hypothetical protein
MTKFSIFSRRDNLVQSKFFSYTMVKPEKHGGTAGGPARERAGALVGCSSSSFGYSARARHDQPKDKGKGKEKTLDCGGYKEMKATQNQLGVSKKKSTNATVSVPTSCQM